MEKKYAQFGAGYVKEGSCEEAHQKAEAGAGKNGPGNPGRIPLCVGFGDLGEQQYGDRACYGLGKKDQGQSHSRQDAVNA